MPTIVIQPDESAALDTSISETSPDTPTPSPITLLLLADGGSSNKESIVISFDVSVVPAGSTIDTATLRISNISGPTGDHDYRCARLTQPWVEAEVTWNSYEFGNVWPGGAGAASDVDLTDAETGTVLNDEDLEFTITPLTQDALDDRSGFLDMLINTTDISAAGGSYHSSSSGARSLRPRLTIEYTAAPPDGGGAPVKFRNHPIRRNADENRGFDGQEIL